MNIWLVKFISTLIFILIVTLYLRETPERKIEESEKFQEKDLEEIEKIIDEYLKNR